MHLSSKPPGPKISSIVGDAGSSLGLPWGDAIARTARSIGSSRNRYLSTTFPADGRTPREDAFPCGRDGLRLSRVLRADGAPQQPVRNAHQSAVSFLNHAAA